MSHSETLGIAAYRRSNRVTVLRLVGELDLSTTGRLSQVVDELDVGAGQWLVVHLADVGFVSSSGLSALLAARRGLLRRGAELALHDPCPQVCRLIDLAGLERLLPILDEPDMDALCA